MPSPENVYLLLHFDDGVDGSQVFTDSSTYENEISVYGTCEIDTAISKFGAGSALFDDYSAYFELAAPTTFNGVAWCVELWVYLTTVGDGFGSAEINLFTLSHDDLIISVCDDRVIELNFTNESGPGGLTGTIPIVLETWTHVAVSYDLDTIRLFVGGVLDVDLDGVTFSHYEVGDTWSVYGAVSDTDPASVYNLDEYRITVGEAVYTEEFTPSGPFSVTGAYTVAATIEIGETAAAYAPTAIIEIRGTETYPVTAAIEISAPVYAVTAGISVSGTETYAVTGSIAIQGSAHTAANRTAITWSATVSIDGTDVSARRVGDVDIEYNEDASNVASLTLIPASGTLEPLGYLGKTLTITWDDAGDGTYTAHAKLLFTGPVVDAGWDPDTGLLVIEATSDMQGAVERMDRTSIAAMTGGTWSDLIFEEEADNWQYAQDRLSTTTDTLWQDAMGAIRTASLAAKESADFTFADAGRFSDSLQITTASVRDLVNEIRITMDYRYARKRHRQIRVRWIGVQDVCTFLSNPFTLCTRQMVQSAASGAGWTVVGDITYTDVWPPGAYPCGGGTYGVKVWGYDPIVAQLDSKQDLSTWCMGATWQAARRYVQRVTETHTAVVRCQDSIDAVGRLLKTEDYGAESDTDVSDWDQTDASAGPPSGATQLASGDWVLDVDAEGEIDRDAIDEALEAAMAAARGDILRSHRQTRVSFQTVFQPMVDLSHTVRVNCTALQATGKVTRIAHLLSGDTGEASTTIEIAVSRHEGSGLSVSDTIAAPAKPTATDGETITSTLLIGQWTGGSVADYLDPGSESDEYTEIEGEAGFFTNVQFDPVTRTVIGAEEPNPILAKHIYPVQFVVSYPEISGAHIDAVGASTDTTIEVAVPEDELTCTQ